MVKLLIYEVIIMASTIIHICVAKKLNEYLNYDNKHLLLGTIAPDISKLVGETKQKSHFLTDYNSDIPDIKWFLSKYEKHLKDPFSWDTLYTYTQIRFGLMILCPIKSVIQI